MARLRKLINWFRGAASSTQKHKRRHHDTIKSAKRWNHRTVARGYSVPEDVVRRIYGAVQTAKRQGLHGGYMVDLIERSVGRKLIGNEYDVATRAKEHLEYSPPGGYRGPEPKGSAKEPPRPTYGDPEIRDASEVAYRADKTIKDVLARKERWADIVPKDRELLRQAADELDVSADLYEGAGSVVHAGTLRERARYARGGDARRLEAYRAHSTIKKKRRIRRIRRI